MLEAHSPAVLLACLVFGPIPLYPAGIPGLSHSTQNPTSEPIAIERFVRGSVRGQDPAGEVREEGNPTLEAERGADDPTRPANPQDKPERDELPSIESFVTGMQSHEGLISCWWDPLEGRLFLAPPPAETELLSLISLPGGLGSNEVGLDRGQLGEQRLVRFERHGARVLLVAPNLRWRAEGAPAAVAAGVADSFAPGVLWGFELVAKDGDGGVLVDATDFFLRDAHGIARKLKSTGQGDYELETSRSTLLPERLGAFPENLDVEALLTFVADEPGAEVAATSGDPRAPALRVRHSFIALPELDPPPHHHTHFWRPCWMSQVQTFHFLGPYT